MSNAASQISAKHQRAPQFRQKRNQVARACDGCRMNRTKCDVNRPCYNCKSNGRHCSNNDAPRASTVSRDYKEIETLRHKVKELEAKLEEARQKASHSPQAVKPGSIVQDHGISKKTWLEGIQVRPARSPHVTWFGPSSQYYFIKRLSIYLASSLQQTHSADHMLLKSASNEKLLDSPNSNLKDKLSRRALSSTNDYGDMTTPYLSPTEEEYFINLFWHSYHTSLFAIIDEAEFRKHYQTLWVESSKARKPSAIVDIVLAMCMQYAISSLPASKQGNFTENNDATVAGRRYYGRCQRLLTYELESPTISTLQCHLLCAIYLCGGSFHNMVDSSCGLALRTAYMLGLHLEPPKNMPQQQQEHRRRLWWAVYVLDSKINIKLGRPFLVPDSYSMPSLPSDSLEVAIVSGSTFGPLGDNATWLSFSLYQTTLYLILRAAHTAFYDNDIGLHNIQAMWDNPQTLEAATRLLEPYTKHLDEWVRAVPNVLKTKRQNDGRPLSTDSSALEIEQFAPLWLQRQRLLLELTYHNLCLNLYRPFIPLVPAPLSSPSADKMSIICAAHAMAFTNITLQVLSSTSILNGWHEVFQWQWNAAMTLVGFVLAYPQHQSTPAARSAIDLSVLIFDIFGKGFGIATSAAKIVRDLCPEIDFLTKQSRTPLMSSVDSGNQDKEQFTDDKNSMAHNGSSVGTGLYDMDGSNPDLLFDMALDIDFWADFDMLWPNVDPLPDYEVVL